VDTTGGDKGLDVVVEGAIAAVRDLGVSLILVGPEEQLRSKIDALGAKSLAITICHAPDTIAMDESPTKAVRRKPDSSLCVAYNLVQSGRASAILSAGNSGAMMAAGRILCGLIPGIERPAIATLLPVLGEGVPNVILDTGANVDCHAHNLVQFAIMGSVYCSTLLGVPRPKVALLSNGSEATKGNDIIRAAAVVLGGVESLSYVGYVEGRDIASKTADVIVCDGFIGNVVLKSLEGCVRLIFEQLVLEGKKGFFRKLGLALSKGVYREVFAQKFDYSAYGGAPLLGLRKLAVVLHGSSDARAVKNAIRVSDEFAQKRMTEKISQELARLEESSVDLGSYPLSGVFAGGREGQSNDGQGAVRDEREQATPAASELPEERGE
jgi:glycerol-3-phosphate acyltransferase PlsX